MTTPLDAVNARLDADFDAAVERLADFLRIPSVSTDRAFDAETRRAGAWIVDQLASMGFHANLRDTPRHPMVVAHHPGPGGDAPRVLYYGHYDVQPPDPIELWTSGPFDPVVVEDEHGGRIVARGAVDDKGQVMTFVEAFRGWVGATGSLPVAVTVLLEGEEESGSESFDPFVEANRDELAADVAVVCDTGMWDIETPAITYMLRGLVYVDVTLTGPSHDLHSGMYGGSVVNPINALTRVLAQLHDEDGVVQIPGFYDDVQPLGAEEAAQWKLLGFDERAFLASAGVEVAHGERGHTTLERVWCRPTCDLNGIVGGYTGKGAKTVIASKASCKMSCRLVADQDPQRVHAGIVRFLEERTPPGCRWSIELHGRSPAIRVPTDSPWLQAAMRGLESAYGRRPALIGTGGSIPAVGSMQRLLGLDPLLVGFGLDDDRVHSPNEKFQLACLRNGIRSHAAILQEMAAAPGRS